VSMAPIWDKDISCSSEVYPNVSATPIEILFAHEKAMEKIKEKYHRAYHWLREKEPLEHWVRLKY